MINTKELEKRWYKYKAKNFILIFALILIFILLPYGIYYLYDYFDTPSPKQEVSKLITPQEVVVESSTPMVTEATTAEPEVEESKDNEVILAPTIPIVDLDKEQRTTQAKKVVHRKQAEEKKLVKAKPSSSLTAQELAVINGNDLKREKQKISFQRSSSNYMDVMKTKFEQNKNPREALLLAKAYYKAGDYINAEEWALKANSLDKNMDESWFVFAKAKSQTWKT
ncbi:MAG: CDC27 family protein [Epsilonproteobacteria bacterium]|nr:CDC27 family protein [Campylobacterota bacterium]